MTASDHDLLGQFTRDQSQDAFAELVRCHLDLVYSAALRQVRSPQLAEEVSQSVFLELARTAATLKTDTILTAWLYQVTRNAAIDVVRREARRQAREQIAFEMSELNDPSAEWAHIEPLLDEAMASLEGPDRTAILLRYFENKSLREVGEALGASEDAAQKRVSRAVDRLREFFSRRKVTVGSAALAGLVSGNALQAAPPGLAASIAATAASASLVATSTAVAVTKVIAMTTLQKSIVAAVVAAGMLTAAYQTRQVSNLRSQVQTLQAQQGSFASLSNRVQELQRERDQAVGRLAAASADTEASNKTPAEMLKLRGEVGRLRRENTDMGSASPLSKVTANAEARKLLRDQQKVGMTMIYSKFAKGANLSPDQTDKFDDLLADHIMENVGHVTALLRDKPGTEQMDQVFAAQDAALQEKLQALLGQDATGQYQEYTRNLLGTLSADQFKSTLSGNDAAREEKAQQLSKAIQEAVPAALAGAGLPADYQAVPILNFRNIVSEQAADQSLKLLADVYQRAAAASSTFLSPDELQKFQAFSDKAVQNSRAALMLNRTMMAPLAN